MKRLSQNSFLSGQLDYEMMGRQDFDKYAKGASELVNFNLLKRGGIRKRQGFDRLVELDGALADTGGRVRLVPFAVKKETGFVLVFSRGRCTAVCTLEGRVYAYWDVPPYEVDSVPQGFDTDEQVAGFDWCQCGYRLYLAHQSRHPSVIEANIDDIESAVSAANEGRVSRSPFVWKRFSVAGLRDGVPHITGFLQTRIAPTADASGGKVVEKYKVSAVFDGEETVPSAETYDASYIGVYKGCSTLVQKSCSPAYSTTSYSDGTSGKQKTVMNQPGVCSSVYSNRKVFSVNGTAYLAPWVESQVINITAKVVPRTVGGKAVYPDQIRFYKKEKGYYGIIGAVDVGKRYKAVDINLGFEAGDGTPMTADDSEDGIFNRDDTLSPYKGQYELPGNEYIDRVASVNIPFGDRTMDDGEAVYADESDDIENGAGSSVEDAGDEEEGGLAYTVFGVSTGKTEAEYEKALTGCLVADGYKIVVTGASGRAFDADRCTLRLWLGGIFSKNTEFNKNNAGQPKRQVVSYQYNSAESVVVEVAYSYVPFSGGAAVEGVREFEVGGVPHRAPRTVSVEGGAEAEVNEETVLGEYYKSSGYWTRKGQLENIDKAKKANAGRYEDEWFDIDVAAHTADLKNLGDSISISSIKIRGVGVLTVNAVSVKNLEYDDTVTLEDKNIIADTSITPYEEDETPDPFSSPGDYPACVCIAQQRLIWASSRKEPERVWMSEVGDFTVYTPHEIQKPDDTIEFDLPVTRFAKLNHIVEMKSLLAFNSACEWLIDSASDTQGITYETVQARPQSYTGSNERLKPIVCDTSIVFVERTGQAVRMFGYDIQNNGFSGTDISILANSIFADNTIVDWSYQQFPNGVIWCVLHDGTMASITLNKQQNTVAWGTHRHCGGGRFEAISTSWAVSPSLEDVKSAGMAEIATHQEMFCVVRDAQGRRWLERMRVQNAQEDSVYNSLTLDSMRVATDAGEYSVSGNPGGMLPEAAGARYYSETDGSEMSRAEAAAHLSGGSGRRVYEGWPVDAKFTSVYPILGQTVGDGQFDIKDITNVGLRLMGSVGGEVASKHFEDRKEPVRYLDDLDNPKTGEASEDPSVQTEKRYRARFHDVDVANVKPFGANCRDGRVTVTQGLQWPFCLLSLEVDYATENEGAER